MQQKRYTGGIIWVCETTLCPDISQMTEEMVSHVLASAACTTCYESPKRCFTSTQPMWPDHCIQDIEA